MLRTAAAEFVGSFLLVLVGTGVAPAAALGQNTAGPAYDSFAIAFSYGLKLTAVVATLAQVSGAHVTPAVTIAPWPDRKIPLATSAGRTAPVTPDSRSNPSPPRGGASTAPPTPGRGGCGQ